MANNITGTLDLVVEGGGKLVLTGGGPLALWGSGMGLALTANSATINAGSTLEIDGSIHLTQPLCNQGTLVVVGTGGLIVADVPIYGKATPTSGTEIYLWWTGFGGSGGTTCAASTDGINYETRGGNSTTDSSALFSGLARSTSYHLKATAASSGGGTAIYESDPVSTLNLADTSGWYNIGAIICSSITYSGDAWYPTFPNLNVGDALVPNTASDASVVNIVGTPTMSQALGSPYAQVRLFNLPSTPSDPGRKKGISPIIDSAGSRRSPATLTPPAH